MSSPSSTKVDDFLSQLSLMSHQKLQEDSQRQRQLQRNIDELRSKLNSVSPVRPPPKPARPLAVDAARKLNDIPSIKFNRPGSTDSAPPPMPLRPSEIDREEGQPPRLPIRKSSRPERPARKSAEAKEENLVDLHLDLVQPTAAPAFKSALKPNLAANYKTSPAYKDTNYTSTLPPILPRKPNRQAQTDSPYTSFTAMETSIKRTGVTGGDSGLESVSPAAGVTKGDSDPKPASPFAGIANTSIAKSPARSSGWLSSLNNSKAASTNQALTIVKPLHLDGIAATGSARNSYSNITTSPTQKQQYIPAKNDPTDVKIIQLSPKRERSSMSWLDSAVNKSPEQPKRGIIVKNRQMPGSPGTNKDIMDTGLGKKPPIRPPKPERKQDKFGGKPELEPTNEVLSQIEKLRKSPTKTGRSSPNEGEVQSDRLEYLERLNKMKTSDSLFQKPSLKSSYSKYEEQDSKMLREQLEKSSSANKSNTKVGGKVPPKPARPSAISYEQKDSEILRSQMKKLNSRQVAEHKKEEEPEGLKALSNLKSARAPAKPPAPKPEALKKFESLKSSQGVSATLLAKQTEEPEVLTTVAAKEGKEAAPTSFHDKLSNILRASTAPQLQSEESERKQAEPTSIQTVGVHRSASYPASTSRSGEKRLDTKGGQLSHTNKSRSKGPKRRLPGSMKKGGSSTTPTAGDSKPEQAEQVIPDFKKKVPPVVNRQSKRNALENLKPSRNFSGELFI